MPENYLINPINPMVSIRHPAFRERAFRIGSTGRFGPFKRKMKRKSKNPFVTLMHKPFVERSFRVTDSGQFGPLPVHKSTKHRKLKSRRNTMSPLMLVNKRRKSHKRKGVMPAHLRAYAFKSKNPKRKHAKRHNLLACLDNKRRYVRKYRRLHNPKRKAFFGMKKGTAMMEVVIGSAFALGGGAISTFGVAFVNKTFPTVTILQSPVGKIALRLGLAAILYQAHRIKAVGTKNATFLAVGAVIPALGEIVTLVGAAKMLPIGTPGVGLLPRKYQAGNMSMIMPAQNMAGAGEGGW